MSARYPNTVHQMRSQEIPRIDPNTTRRTRITNARHVSVPDMQLGQPVSSFRTWEATGCYGRLRKATGGYAKLRMATGGYVLDQGLNADVLGQGRYADELARKLDADMLEQGLDAYVLDQGLNADVLEQ